MHYRLARRDFSWRDHSRVKAFFRSAHRAHRAHSIGESIRAHAWRNFFFARGERESETRWRPITTKLADRLTRQSECGLDLSCESKKTVVSFQEERGKRTRLGVRNKTWNETLAHRFASERCGCIFRTSVYHTWLLDLARLCAENIINREFNATPLDIYAQIE